MCKCACTCTWVCLLSFAPIHLGRSRVFEMFGQGVRHSTWICKDEQFRKLDLSIKSKHWTIQSTEILNLKVGKNSEWRKSCFLYLNLLGEEKEGDRTQRKEPSVVFPLLRLGPNMWNQSPSRFGGIAENNLARKKKKKKRIFLGKVMPFSEKSSSSAEREKRWQGSIN